MYSRVGSSLVFSYCVRMNLFIWPKLINFLFFQFKVNFCVTVKVCLSVFKISNNSFCSNLFKSPSCEAGFFLFLILLIAFLFGIEINHICLNHHECKVIVQNVVLYFVASKVNYKNTIRCQTKRQSINYLFSLFLSNLLLLSHLFNLAEFRFVFLVANCNNMNYYYFLNK